MATYLMPKIADSTDDYVIVSIEVVVGDSVSDADIVLVVETDKVDVEIQARFSGVVTTLLLEDGAEVSVGDPVLEYREAA